MSLVYSLPLPATGDLSWSTTSPVGCAAEITAQADVKRSHVRQMLKTSQKDLLGVYKALDDYLPYITALQAGSRNGTIVFTKQVQPRWRMPLDCGILGKPASKILIPGVDFEFAMIILSLAAVRLQMANRALIATNDQQLLDKNWKQSNSHLLDAYKYLQFMTRANLDIPQTPLDLFLNTIRSFMLMIEGSMHLNIMYKNLDTGAKTSPSLLCRLAIYAYEKFSSSKDLLSSVSGKSQGAELICRWLAKASIYCHAAANRYMALENESKNNIGVAISLLRAANNDLEKQGHKFRSITKKVFQDTKGGEGKGDDGFAERYQQLDVLIHKMVDGLKQQNDQVYFQLIPDPDKITSQAWPSGRQVLDIPTEWNPRSALQPAERSASQSNQVYF